jgi:membrane-associated phospholipid phosphatase
VTLDPDASIVKPVSVRNLLRGTALASASVAVGYAALRIPAGADADRAAFAAVNAGHGPAADRCFAGVTELGSLYAAGAAAGSLAVTGHTRVALRAASAAGATWLLGQALKKFVTRPRPYERDPETVRRMIAPPSGTSWPSSHPAVLTSFTTVAARDLGLGATARAALAGLGCSVAASRVYLGVHYPSDVVSGLLMGRAVAALWRR